MALPRSSVAAMLRNVIHQPLEGSEAGGPSDDSFPAIDLQHPEKKCYEGAPRVPPTAATGKNTPLRPVYDDFATAYSSITSRSASGRSRDMSYKSPKKQASPLKPGRQLSRRAHKSLRRQKKPLEDEALKLPMPAKVFHHRPISEFDFDISDVHSTSSRQHEAQSSLERFSNVASPKRPSASSLFDSLKKAVGGKSSPVAKSSQSRFSLSFKWPRDSMELPSLARKVDQPAKKEVEDGEGQTKSALGLVSTRPPDPSFYTDDPFVYESGQNRMSCERTGKDDLQALSSSQRNRDSTDSYENHNAAIMLASSQNEYTVHRPLETFNYLHGGMALAIDSQRALSTRESSMVDNSVKQYATNNGLWDISLDSNDENSEDNDLFRHSELQKGAQNDVSGHGISGSEDDLERRTQLEGSEEGEKPVRAFKLIESSGRAPNAGLPQIPSLPDQQTLKSISDGLGQSSSYGDTRNLLDITQRSQGMTSTSPNDFHPGKTLQLGQAVRDNINPFRPGPNQILLVSSLAAADSSPNSRLSQKMAPTVSDITEDLAGTPRLALERDISCALRRMSALSNLSQETSTHDQGDGGFQSSTDSDSLLNFISRARERAPDVLKLAPQDFYHESSIRQTWLDSQRIERVRVPIGRNVSVSSSLPTSNSASSVTDEFDLVGLDGLDQNGTEWETVMDGMIDRVNTAGSSLANNSSTGNISLILYEPNEFSSTDRIVQHPAQIDYSHDYRYREIKEGKFPVLLPSYKPHTVNGFPVNSYRSISTFQQSSGNFYQPPPPLSRSHTNPFSSPPPEVITNKSKSSETVDRNQFLVDETPNLKLGIASRVVDKNGPCNWIDELDLPGPAIRQTAPTSNMGGNHHSANSLSRSYTGSQIIGSSIADASSSALSTIIHDLEHLGDTRKGGASNFSRVAAYDASSAAQERAPFIKGPPGAFYQGVRSRPDPRRRGLSLDCKAVARLPQRKASQKYPTNQMRPLSLLQTQRAELGAGADGRQLGERPHNDFLYRSPLAPIKSRSWCKLYTQEQLSSMHPAVKTNGIDDFEYIAQQSSRPAFGECLKMDGSWKRTWSPHLRPWPRDNSSIKTDLASRKVKISTLIFGLCCLFPPMLVLYGVGYLDNLMLWTTEGEISAFSKTHKRAALHVVCFFFVAIMIAVPIVVTVKVIRSK